MTDALTFDDGTTLNKGDHFIATFKADDERKQIELEILGTVRGADKLVVGQNGDKLGTIGTSTPIPCRDDDCIGRLTQGGGRNATVYSLHGIEVED